jgi:hypothetical protein
MSCVQLSNDMQVLKSYAMKCPQPVVMKGFAYLRAASTLQIEFRPSISLPACIFADVDVFLIQNQIQLPILHVVWHCRCANLIRSVSAS